MSIYTVSCRCGYHDASEYLSRAAAEVAGDTHESRDIRRPYRHDARVAEVQR